MGLKEILDLQHSASFVPTWLCVRNTQWWPTRNLLFLLAFIPLLKSYPFDTRHPTLPTYYCVTDQACWDSNLLTTAQANDGPVSSVMTWWLAIELQESIYAFLQLCFELSYSSIRAILQLCLELSCSFAPRYSEPNYSSWSNQSVASPNNSLLMWGLSASI